MFSSSHSLRESSTAFHPSLQARKLCIIRLLLSRFSCLSHLIHHHIVSSLSPQYDSRWSISFLFPLIDLAHATSISGLDCSNSLQLVSLSPVVFANQIHFPHCSQNVLFKVQIWSIRSPTNPARTNARNVNHSALESRKCSGDLRNNFCRVLFTFFFKLWNTLFLHLLVTYGQLTEK